MLLLFYGTFQNCAPGGHLQEHLLFHDGGP